MGTTRNYSIYIISELCPFILCTIYIYQIMGIINDITMITIMVILKITIMIILWNELNGNNIIMYIE